MGSSLLKLLAALQISSGKTFDIRDSLLGEGTMKSRGLFTLKVKAAGSSKIFVVTHENSRQSN